MRSRDILLEAQKYEGMFTKLLELVSGIEEGGKECAEWMERDVNALIKWAREKLGKQDRIVWFLKQARLDMVVNWSHYEPLNKLLQRWVAEYRKETGEAWQKRSLSGLKEALEHYLSLPIASIQNFVWTGESVPDLINFMAAAEKKWQETQKYRLKPRDEDEILIDFHDGWAWFLLPRASCRDEGRAMGHCGNSPRDHTSDRILSLRRKVDDEHWKPYATFILHEDGALGEMKGRFNDRPAVRESEKTREIIHAHIAALLRHPLIKSIQGGGYLAKNNFSIRQLAPELQADLVTEKPELADTKTLMDRYGSGDQRFKDKFADEMTAHFNQTSWDWVDDDTIKVDGESSAAAVVKNFYDLASTPAMKRVLELSEGEFEKDRRVQIKNQIAYREDLVFLDDYSSFREWLTESESIRATVEARRDSFETFLETQHHQLVAMFRTLQHRVEAQCDKYLCGIVYNTHLSTPAYYERVSDGNAQYHYELRVQIEPLVDAFAELGEGEDEDYGFSAWFVNDVQEHGWNYISDDSSYEEDLWRACMKPDEFLRRLLASTTSAIEKTISRMVRFEGNLSFHF